MSRLVLSSARRAEEGKSKKEKGKKGKAESVKHTIAYCEIVALMSRLVLSSAHRAEEGKSKKEKGKKGRPRASSILLTISR